MDYRTVFLVLWLVALGWIFGVALCWPAHGAVSSLQRVQVQLSWVDNSGVDPASMATGFIIERCTGVNCVTFGEVSRSGQGITVASDFIDGDPGGVVYRYRVLAFNSAGRSAPSNIAELVSPAIFLLAAPASGVIATIVGVAVTVPGAAPR